MEDNNKNPFDYFERFIYVISYILFIFLAPASIIKDIRKFKNKFSRYIFFKGKVIYKGISTDFIESKEYGKLSTIYNYSVIVNVGDYKAIRNVHCDKSTFDALNINDDIIAVTFKDNFTIGFKS